MGFDIICDLPHIIGDGHRNGWPHNYGRLSKMQKTNYDCGNCNHHWQAEKLQIECPECDSFYIMASNEWDYHDSREPLFEDVQP